MTLWVFIKVYLSDMLTPENYQEYIGRAIRLARKTKGFVQIDLYAATEIQRTYIAEVELGKRKLSLYNLIKLATALDTTASQLMAQAEALAKDEKLQES